MQYAYLGRTGMKVSRIALGTGTFGGGGNGYGNWGSVVEKDAHYLMDMAKDAGINFFDTANAYGNHGDGGYCGLSESIIGTWFAKGGGRRESTILSTKMGHVVAQYTYDGPNLPGNVSLYKIRRHFKESMKRLQTDHLEMYVMHDIDKRTTWDEVWEAMECLVRSGQVDYIGSSNAAAWQVMKANEAARKRGFMGLASEQHVYNLIHREAELEIFPMSRDQGVGITIFSPLYRGVLGVDLLEPQKRELSLETQRVIEKYRPVLTEYAKLCHDINEPVAAVSIAWQLLNPHVCSSIIGPCTPEDLSELIHAADIVLDESTIKRLDELFPGPGGEAPYAYEGWNELNK